MLLDGLVDVLVGGWVSGSVGGWAGEWMCWWVGVAVGWWMCWLRVGRWVGECVVWIGDGVEFDVLVVRVRNDLNTWFATTKEKEKKEEKN